MTLQRIRWIQLLFVISIAELIAERPKYLKHITILEQQLHSLKSSNTELQNARSDMEKRVTDSLSTVRDSTKREQEALAKVQELLNITDLAIAEKNATLLREKDIRGNRGPSTTFLMDDR